MFGLLQNIWTGTKHFGSCKRIRHLSFCARYSQVIMYREINSYFNIPDLIVGGSTWIIWWAWSRTEQTAGGKGYQSIWASYFFLYTAQYRWSFAGQIGRLLARAICTIQSGLISSSGKSVTSDKNSWSSNILLTMFPSKKENMCEYCTNSLHKRFKIILWMQTCGAGYEYNEPL